jgi:hypothetical protein
MVEDIIKGKKISRMSGRLTFLIYNIIIEGPVKSNCRLNLREIESRGFKINGNYTIIYV